VLGQGARTSRAFLRVKVLVGNKTGAKLMLAKLMVALNGI
jgi:hypothetical protein